MDCVFLTAVGARYESLLHASELLLAQTSCTREELWRSLALDSQSAQRFCAAYQSRIKHIRFCHYRTLQTCEMHTIKQSFAVDDGTVYNIYTVQHMEWADDECDKTLGYLEASLCVRRVSHTVLTRNGIDHIAVPMQELTVCKQARSRLATLNCEGGVNVSYKTQAAFRIRRSHLFPKLLINVQPTTLLSRVWTILRLEPEPSQLACSDQYSAVFGQPTALTGLPGRLRQALTALKCHYRAGHVSGGVATFDTLRGPVLYRYSIKAFRSFHVVVSYETIPATVVRDVEDELAQTWPPVAPRRMQ